MSDTKLIAKLSEGDMISRDAIYHKECLTGLHNRYQKFLKEKESPSNKKRLQSIAVAETAVYLEEQLEVNDKISATVKLSELIMYYKQVSEHLNLDLPERINSTRLKEDILALCPEVFTHSEGKEIIFAFKDDVV